MRKSVVYMFSASALIATLWLVFHPVRGSRNHPPQTAAPAERDTTVYAEVVGGTPIQWGSLKKNQRTTRTIAVKNTSASETLQITGVKRSCGCLGGHAISRSLVPPGETTEIDIELLGKKTGSARDNYVNIMFADHPMLSIPIFYTIEEDISVFPEEVRIGSRYQDERVTGFVYLRPIGGFNLKMETWKSSHATVTIEKVEEISGGLRCYYACSTARIGTCTDTLNIMTNASIDRVVEVPFTWEVVPNLEFVPATIFWGILDSGSKKEREVLLRSVDGREFVVESFDCNNQIFGIEPISDTSSPLKEFWFILRTKTPHFETGRVVSSGIRVVTDRGPVYLKMLGNVLTEE